MTKKKINIWILKNYLGKDIKFGFETLQLRI